MDKTPRRGGQSSVNPVPKENKAGCENLQHFCHLHTGSAQVRSVALHVQLMCCFRLDAMRRGRRLLGAARATSGPRPKAGLRITLRGEQTMLARSKSELNKIAGSLRRGKATLVLKEPKPAKLPDGRRAGTVAGASPPSPGSTPPPNADIPVGARPQRCLDLSHLFSQVSRGSRATCAGRRPALRCFFADIMGLLCRLRAGSPTPADYTFDERLQAMCADPQQRIRIRKFPLSLPRGRDPQQMFVTKASAQPSLQVARSRWARYSGGLSRGCLVAPGRPWRMPTLGATPNGSSTWTKSRSTCR